MIFKGIGTFQNFNFVLLIWLFSFLFCTALGNIFMDMTCYLGYPEHNLISFFSCVLFRFPKYSAILCQRNVKKILIENGTIQFQCYPHFAQPEGQYYLHNPMKKHFPWQKAEWVESNWELNLRLYCDTVTKNSV